MPVERIRFSLLDFKLGGRMLARYPGLTVVGGLAMAFAIWVGAGTFEFLNQVVNPTLPFRDVGIYQFWFRLTLGVSAVALLLSLSGIYAVMAFTVSRRTREIGIRVALGSDRRRMVTSIFRRPLVQVTAGILVGTVFVAALFALGRGGLPTAAQFAKIGVYAVVMTLVCLLACIVPTRRALGVEPTDALRVDA